jgi:hypothetical protein
MPGPVRQEPMLGWPVTLTGILTLHEAGEE